MSSDCQASAAAMVGDDERRGDALSIAKVDCLFLSRVRLVGPLAVDTLLLRVVSIGDLIFWCFS